MVIKWLLVFECHYLGILIFPARKELILSLRALSSFALKYIAL